MIESKFNHLIFEDDFNSTFLNKDNWFPYYLPHWSSLENAKANYAISDSILRLSIAKDQKPWCPEYDGEIKVSGIQTGHFSNQLGEKEGQHRFNHELRVRHFQSKLALFLPQYCHLEMRAKTKLNKNNLAALWLIGFEDSPEKSGEITLFEAFGNKVNTDGAYLGRGIKKITDPELFDEVDESLLPINVQDWHTYSMEWTPSGIRFFLDGELITETQQSPNYPMQLMLNFYEFPDETANIATEDAWFDIDYIRAYGSEK